MKTLLTLTLLIWGTALSAQITLSGEREITSMQFKPYGQKGNLKFSKYTEITGLIKLHNNPYSNTLVLIIDPTMGNALREYWGTIEMVMLIKQDKGFKTYLVSCKAPEGPYTSWEIEYNKNNAIWRVKEVGSQTLVTYQ